MSVKYYKIYFFIDVECKRYESKFEIEVFHSIDKNVSEIRTCQKLLNVIFNFSKVIFGFFHWN